jgi:hypothetical protein
MNDNPAALPLPFFDIGLAARPGHSVNSRLPRQLLCNILFRTQSPPKIEYSLVSNKALMARARDPMAVVHWPSIECLPYARGRPPLLRGCRCRLHTLLAAGGLSSSRLLLDSATQRSVRDTRSAWRL